MGLDISILNVYGQHSYKILLWERLFKSKQLDHGHTIMGRDLNFTVGNVKIRGEVAIVEPLFDYFVKNMEDRGLFDVVLVRIKPN